MAMFEPGLQDLEPNVLQDVRRAYTLIAYILVSVKY